MSTYKHLFGPLQSRRLGVSLGIDLIPFKTCSLNCVYCECGKTTCLTTSSDTFISTDAVIHELKDFLKSNPHIDHLTFSGPGEPTLAGNIGTVIDFLKNYYPQYKVCVLTNGTLLNEENVRQRIKKADIVIPTLNAATPYAYNKINRPAQNIKVAEVIQGLIDFRHEYTGKLWIELFIVPGVNDSLDELQALKTAFNNIRPDLIQLNALDRLGTESWVTTVPKEELEKIGEFFKPLHVAIYPARSQNIQAEGTRRQALG